MPLHDLIRQRLQPLTAVLTSNRIFLYSVFSTLAVIATIANASRAHSNFYSVSVHVARSSRSVLILANFGFLASLLCGRILQKLFFGSLQPREVERLYDQTWMFVTESLLAFTIFRDEFDVPFLLMFGFLLFVKCFHWLMADRVESMDQTNYPGPPTLFHIRINSLFFLLWAVDLVMFAFAVESTLTNGVGGMVLFASEYAILLASALNAMLRYTLSILDLRRARVRGGENAPPWENKSMYIFYIELLTDFLKLATYMTFFMIILTFYGLPLNIIRDVFVTARSFITRLRALIRYHNATRDMDRRYPHATEEELTEMSDRTCIICREEMQTRNPVVPPAAAAPNANGEQDQQQQQQPLPPADGPNMTPKKLPCGHIFHFQCLRSWLERQQSCPTCRRTVLETNPPPAQNQAPAQGQARPLPGAAPIPGGPQGQQGAAAAPANPLGWVGRVLGLPLQPPALDARFPGAGAQGPLAQGPPPQFQYQQPPIPNAGWAAQLPGVPGQAPPPYYDPMQGWQHQLPAPGQPPQMHMQLQPPPVFRGFYGPGQAWQAWGDPRWFAPQQPGQQQPLQQPAAASPQPHAHAPVQAIPVQAPGTPPPPASTPAALGDGPPVVMQAPTPAPTTHVAGSEPSTPPSANEDARPNDARAAAALAALRRRQHGSANPASSSSAPGSETSARSTGVAGTNNATASALRLGEAAGLSSASPMDPPAKSISGPSIPPSASSAHLPNATAEAHRETHVPTPAPALPTLIPMYDPSVLQPPRFPGPANPYFAAAYGQTYGARPAGPAPPRLARLGSASGSSSHSYSLTASTSHSHAHAHSTSHSHSHSSAGAVGAGRTPLSQLPPTLTEEQLARLDGATREAIDERLRVLEGVGGAVQRCIEELTRVRSVLPPQALGTGAGARRAPTGAGPDAGAGAGGDAGQSASTAGGAAGVVGNAVKGKGDGKTLAVAEENGNGSGNGDGNRNGVASEEERSASESDGSVSVNAAQAPGVNERASAVETAES